MSLCVFFSFFFFLVFGLLWDWSWFLLFGSFWVVICVLDVGVGPVTIADQAAEEAMVSIILGSFPAHAMYVKYMNRRLGSSDDAVAVFRFAFLKYRFGFEVQGEEWGFDFDYRLTVCGEMYD